jgi:hypothetical protein
MHFSKRTFRDKLGALVIQSPLGPPADREHYESRQLFPGVEFGLSGWQRAHSQGAGTGSESPEGIRFAPREVNQVFQNRGIERVLRNLVSEKPDGVDLWLTTATSTHNGTLRLREIQYRVDAVRGDGYECLFEASIEVSSDVDKPRVTVNATPHPNRTP